MEDDIFKLTRDQQLAFRRMKCAHADCLKAGVVFYNNYGHLGALDSKKVADRRYYDDENGDGAILDQGCVNPNELQLECNEWADDDHYFHPA